VDPGLLPILPPQDRSGNAIPARPLTIAAALTGEIESAYDAFVPPQGEPRNKPDPLTTPLKRATSARLVVFGDADFPRDLYAKQVPANVTLALDAIDWATQDASLAALRDRAGPPPVTPHAPRAVAWGVNLLALPGLVTLAGVLRFALRRRRAARAARTSRGAP
jgi:hypothetical protein